MKNSPLGTQNETVSNLTELIRQVERNRSKGSKDKSLSVLYYQRGVSYLENENYNFAYSDFNMSIEIDPTHFKSYYCRGLIHETYFEEKELALDDFKNAIKLNNAFLEALHERAGLYERMGKYKKSLKDYNKLIELTVEKDYEAYHNRGLLYKNYFKNYELALKDYSKSLEINPKFFEGYYNRAILYQDNLNQKEKSLEDYNKAIELNSKDFDCFFNRGCLYEQSFKKFDLAMKDYCKAIEIKDTDELVFFCRGNLYKTVFKNFEKALEDFKKVISLKPKKPVDLYNAHLVVALLYQEKFKKIEKALFHYNKAIETNELLNHDTNSSTTANGGNENEVENRDHDVYIYRGLLYSNHLKEKKKGFDDFSTALEILKKKDNSQVKNKDSILIEIYFNRANLCVDPELKNFEQAINDYTELIYLKKEVELFYFNRAEILYTNFKEYKKALEDYKKVLKLNKNFSGAQKRVIELTDIINNKEKRFMKKHKLTEDEYYKFNSKITPFLNELEEIEKKNNYFLEINSSSSNYFKKDENENNNTEKKCEKEEEEEKKNKIKTKCYIYIGNILKEIISTEMVYLQNMKKLLEMMILLEVKMGESDVNRMSASVQSILKVNFLFSQEIFSVFNFEDMNNESSTSSAINVDEKEEEKKRTSKSVVFDFSNSIFNIEIQKRVIDKIIKFFKDRKFNFYFMFIDQQNNFNQGYLRKKAASKFVTSILNIKSILDVTDLLIRPIQRIPRYQILLENITKYLEKVEKKGITINILSKEDVSLVEKFAEEINQKERNRVNTKKIIKIKTLYNFKFVKEKVVGSSQLVFCAYDIQSFLLSTESLDDEKDVSKNDFLNQIFYDIFLFKNFLCISKKQKKEEDKKEKRLSKFPKSLGNFRKKLAKDGGSFSFNEKQFKKIFDDEMEFDFSNNEFFVYFIVFKKFFILRINRYGKIHFELYLKNTNELMLEFLSALKIRQSKRAKYKIILKTLDEIIGNHRDDEMKTLDEIGCIRRRGGRIIIGRPDNLIKKDKRTGGKGIKKKLLSEKEEIVK